MTLPISPSELITQSLQKLSNDLHSQMTEQINQAVQNLQTQMSETLSQLIPDLLDQLIPIIEEEIQDRLQPQLAKMETYLQELKTTNQQQLKMLKLGREEYQLLQDKMQQALNQLDSIQPIDDNEFKQLLKDLENSIITLQRSNTMQNKDLKSLITLIKDLAPLKTDMKNSLAHFTQQQKVLDNSLKQFQPLLMR
ncbi:conserved hypothetical protein [Enhydrobacter sp. 8BJ]|nr:conserved hypothetical protein [Enhydrobacter sp. 8BJ]